MTYNVFGGTLSLTQSISHHVDTDKLTTANGGMFTSSSARLSSQSC